MALEGSLQHKGAAAQGVPHSAGPNQQLAYLYQNQATEAEFRQWSAAAKAHSEGQTPPSPRSRVLVRVLVGASAGAADHGATSLNVAPLVLGGHARRLVSSTRGAPWHLGTSFNDQARAPGGPAARAAVTTAEDDDDAATDGPAAVAAGAPGPAPGLLECIRVA